jgi:phosphoglucomutase
MDVVRGAGLRISVDPLGGASLAFWHPIAEHATSDQVVNEAVDPAFGFMPLDWDGR